MDIFGNGVIDWWVIGLVVSLTLVLIAWAGLWLWKLMGPKLRFSLPVVLFLLMAGVATVEAQKSGNAPMRMPRLGDLSQLSGMTGGSETPATVTEGRDLVPEDSCGPITYPTNSAPVEALRFFGVAATSSNVWLGIEWPLGEALSALDLYGSWNLSPTHWTRLAELDITSAQSNVVVRHQWQVACSNLVASGHWPTNATGSLGFFQVAKHLDSDGDGILDGDEWLRYGTDPFSRDTDHDGGDDYWEVDLGFDPRVDEPGIELEIDPVDSSSRNLLFGFSPPNVEAGNSSRDGQIPGLTFSNGLPQLPNAWRDPLSFTVTTSFTPPAAGTYTFTVTVDDQVTLSIAGESVTAVWTSGGDNSATLSVGLYAGKAYDLTVHYVNDGGPSSLTTSVEFEGDGSYNPGLEVAPGLVHVSPLGAVVEGLPVALITGTTNPEASYTIEVEVGNGLVIDRSENMVFPETGGSFWQNGARATAVYSLYEDGEKIATDTCTFVCSEAKYNDPACTCLDYGTDILNGCVHFAQPFGSSPRASGIPVGRLVVECSEPNAALFTPAALRFDHPMMRRVIRRRNLDALIVDGLGHATSYRRGLPEGASAGSGGQFFRGADGSFVEELPSGLRIVYSDSGEAVALLPEFGSPIPVADLGIAVSTNSLGWITSVASVADGAMSTSTTGPDAWRLVWSTSGGVAAKTFDFGGNGSNVFTLREQRGEELAFDYRWTHDALTGDWDFERGADSAVATRTVRTREYDADNRVWEVAESRLDENGDATSCDICVIDRNGHSARVVERREGTTGRLLYSATLGKDGRVVSETDELGRTTSHQYDALGRTTRRTVVAEGVPTTVEEFGYAAGLAPADFRPAWRRVSKAGVTIVEESFTYGTTDDGGRTRVVTRTAHGMSRTSREAYDARGRLVFSADEDGKARQIVRADLADGGWTETESVGVVDVDGVFACVPGKSTREIRICSEQGNVVRAERQALAGDCWTTLDWEEATYDVAHRRTGTTFSDGTSSAASWICAGAVWNRSRDGVAITNVYNAAKRRSWTRRWGAMGEVRTDFAYDGEGRVVRETTTAEGCESRVRAIGYDARGRVVSETATDGATTTAAYSADDRVVTTTYADGGTRIESLNADGSTASVTGTAVVPVFTTRGVSAIVRDGIEIPCSWKCERLGAADSPRFRKTYVDGFGDVVRIETSGFGNAVNVQDRFHDAKGRLVRQTETGRPTVEFQYDAFGDCVGETSSAGGESRTTAFVRGFEVQDGVVFESTTTTRSCSDASIAPLVETRRVRRSGLTQALNGCTIDTDVRGNSTVVGVSVEPSLMRRTVTVASPGLANVATNWYADGLLVSNVTRTGVCGRREYDAYRRVVSRTDGRGNATTLNYNPQGRLERVVDASGAATGYAYDVLGRVTEITNAVGNVTTRAYDHRGYLVAEGGATYPVSYGHDVYGDRVSLTTWRDATSAVGDTTTWTRDAASGLVTARINADGNGPTFAYDAQGRLTRRTWARGTVTDYTHDVWGNLTGTSYSDGTPAIACAYDALGRKTSVADSLGTTVFAYDAFGEEASETVCGLYSKTLVRHRDGFGRDAGCSLDGVRESTLVYDSANGRLSQAQLGGTSFAWSYLAGCELRSGLQVGTSVETTWTHEAQRDVLAQVCNRIGGNTVSQYDCVHDSLGRMSAISGSGSAVSSGNVDAFAYNVRDELVSASRNGSAEWVFAYDGIGNRTTSSEGGVSTTYAANSLNQYTSVSTAGSSTFQPTFDIDGNQTLVKTATGVWSVAYNGENRPTLWTCGTRSVTMKYDHMGRRVELVEREGGQVRKFQRFVYDRFLCVQRLDGADGNVVTDRFEWDPTEPVATRPLLWRHGQDSLLYLHDGRKNVTEVVALSGIPSVVAHYDYAPFGKVTSGATTGGVSSPDYAALNPWRFSSEYADDATATDHYNYRDYEPETGRWTSADPLTGSGLSRYAFVENLPSKFDCLGLYAEDVHFKFVYLYAKLLGRPDAEELALGSNAPDHYWMTDPIFNIFTGFNRRRLFHNLNGLSHDGIECYRKCVERLAATTENGFQTGVYLHVIGDTFAHRRLDGTGYDAWVGHAPDWTDPDDVRWKDVGVNRFNEFVDVISSLLGSNNDTRNLRRNIDNRLAVVERKTYGRYTGISPDIRYSEYNVLRYKESLSDVLEDMSKNEYVSMCSGYIPSINYGKMFSIENFQRKLWLEQTAEPALMKCLECARKVGRNEK